MNLKLRLQGTTKEVLLDVILKEEVGSNNSFSRKSKLYCLWLGGGGVQGQEKERRLMLIGAFIEFDLTFILLFSSDRSHNVCRSVCLLQSVFLINFLAYNL